MSADLMNRKREYLRKKVNPLIQALMVSLMKDEPENVEEYCKNWFQSKNSGMSGGKTQEISPSRGGPTKQASSADSHSESASEDDGYDPLEELKKKSQNKLGKPRVSVSAEVFGRFNQKKEYVPKVVPKSEAQKRKIRERLSQAFMFSALDEKEKNIVIDAMEIKEYKAGDVVIKQGDDGDCLYVVDHGKLDCSKIFPGAKQETHLKVYEPGESFGELSLLYNAPRAASIRAKERSVLFALDRHCFNSIVKDSAVKKRNKYMEFLSQIQIFNGLDSYEKSKVCECLNQTTYKPGEYVIRQGERGDTFYLIGEGHADATKKDGTGNETVVYEYRNSGDYFGELALMGEQKPRAANVVARTELTVVSIDQSSFRRLLGTKVMESMKRNFDRYAPK